MANNEKDLEVKLGLDSKPMETGLDRVTSKVSQASTKMAQSLEGATKSAEKLGKQLENAGNKAGGFANINKNAMITGGIMVGTMAARGLANSMEDKAIGQSYSTVSTHAGIGAGVGMQIAGPWGAAIGGLTGAATGLFSAAAAIQKSMAEAERMFAENRVANAKNVDVFFQKIKAQTAEREFSNYMGDPNVTNDAKREALRKRERDATANLNESSRLLKTDAVLSGDASIVEKYKQRILDSLADLRDVAKLRDEITKAEIADREKAEAEKAKFLKLLEKQKHRGTGGTGESAEKVAEDTRRSDVAGMATNDLTRVGLGVAGLSNLNSVQLKTNELIQGQTKILEKIEVNTKGATAKWA